MAKDKKEKREEKIMKKAMLKVKPEKKFKKKKVVNEAGGINMEEREHDQVVVKDTEGLKSGKSKNNALTKIKKKKLKEKKMSKRTSSLEANCEERVSIKKEGKKVSPGKDLGNQEESNSVSKKKLRGKRLSQLKGSLEVNNEERPTAKKEEMNDLGIEEELSSVSKKKSTKRKKKGNQVCNEQGIQSKPGQGLEEKKSQESIEIDMENAEEISSVDEDSSRGMKKWLRDYKESRPAIDVLQQQIDDFISAHEEKLEQEKKEREAAAAEGGWTVVVHHKGRKKTTDAESGTTIGSVAPAAVLDKMSKKKSKEVALDFYRFQKREAQRSEIMMLQEKFEQDKKRIQQLKAARKFRPY